jgi:RTX calcium-binding nonapeptide repeat (4 copies)
MALARMAGLSVVLLVVLAAPAHAIRYAAPSPAGSGNCSSPGDACRLEAAVEGASGVIGPAAAGEEIVVLPGEHVLTASLDLFAAVNVHGVLGQPKPTLRRTGGTMPLVTSNMPAPGVLRHLRLHGTGLTDGFNPVLAAYGGATHTELEVIADGVTAAAVRLSGGSLLRNSTARQSGASGLAIGVGTTGTSRIVGVTAVAQSAAAYGLVMYDFGNAANDVFSARVRNSIIRGGTNDIMVAASGASNDIELQIGHSDFGETVVSGPGAQLTNQGGNLAATSQLTNIASGDFHQLVTSPTRDAGTTDADLGELDVDGEPRASGAAPDIGADEWYVAPPPPPDGGGGPPPADPLPPAKPKACATRKTGSRKNQTLRGGRLGDLLAGLGGNDVLRGLAGADCLNGGKGNDLLIGGSGVDRFSGGPGKDRILAKDSTRESVDCGPGRDTVVADRKDRLRRCERVTRR